MRLEPEVVRAAVDSALAEDLGAAGDVTTSALFERPVAARGHVVARSELVLAGIELAIETFRTRGPDLEFLVQRRDGEALRPGERALTVRGDARPILEAERTALNFLMRMSGVATAARRAVEEVRGTRTRILDTRKTVPGLRRLDKYATAAGGVVNHRMGLYDGVMIKDTHLAAGVPIAQAVERAMAHGHPAAAITVEVESLDQLREALEAGAGRVLLDNMEPETVRAAVELAGGRATLEASGGLRPGRLREYAATGVDFLSLGWITHSAPAADLALETEFTR